MSNKHSFKGPIILLITAIFWGTTFVAQSLGSDHVGPFTYNACRFIITGIILSIISLIIDSKKKKNNNLVEISNNKSNRWIILMAIGVGLSLFLGATFQQVGIDMTKSASKSGFITTIYIVLVPVLGLLLNKKVKLHIWFCLIVALTGSYLISIDGDFNIEVGDLLTLICALLFAVQIVLIDIINPYINSIKLSAIQFVVAGILSFIVMVCTEGIDLNGIYMALPAILYAAIFSGCIAFTLQIVGQKYTEPTVASMIMSLENVVAVISGVIILHEELTLRVIIGCVLIFVAIIFAQLNIFDNKKNKNIC